MVNKAVYYILKNDTALNALVTGVFPIVMPEETLAPCLVFQRETLDVTYDKSGSVIDNSDVSVIMFAKSYPDVVDIASAVRFALEEVTGGFNGVTVISSRVRGGAEGYDIESDTFFQKITFTIKTSKI
jgi:uncharacterized protein DUF3168